MRQKCCWPDQLQITLLPLCHPQCECRLCATGTRCAAGVFAASLAAAKAKLNADGKILNSHLGTRSSDRLADMVAVGMSGAIKCTGTPEAPSRRPCSRNSAGWTGHHGGHAFRAATVRCLQRSRPANRGPLVTNSNLRVESRGLTFSLPVDHAQVQPP